MAMQREKYKKVCRVKPDNDKKKVRNFSQSPGPNSPTSLPVLLYAFIRVIVCTTNKATNSTINKTLLISINVSHFLLSLYVMALFYIPRRNKSAQKIKKIRNKSAHFNTKMQKDVL